MSDKNEVHKLKIDGKEITEVYEETESLIRYRKHDPDYFQEDTFRTVELEGVEGVSIVVGKLKTEKVPEGNEVDAMVLQTYLFRKKTDENPEGWTLTKIRDWLGTENLGIQKLSKTSKSDKNELKVSLIGGRPLTEFYEESETEINYRKIAPEKFVEGSLVKAELDNVPGAWASMGQLKPEELEEYMNKDTRHIQSYTFKKKTESNPYGWTLEIIRKWLGWNAGIDRNAEAPQETKKSGRFSELRDENRVKKIIDKFSIVLPIPPDFEPSDTPLKIKNIFVFSEGQHKPKGHKYTKDEVKQIADNVNGCIAEEDSIPLQVGHSLSPWDTVGTVDRAQTFADNQKLMVDISITDPKAQAKYKRKEFKKMSVSVAELKDGSLILDEISFTPFPAVKEAGKIVFSNKDENSEKENTDMDGKENVNPESTDKNAADVKNPDTQVKTPDLTEQLSKQLADANEKIKAETERAEKFAKELGERKESERKTRVDGIVTKALETGKITPAMKDEFSAFVNTLSASTEKYSDSADGLAVFAGLLDKMSAAIPLGSEIQIPQDGKMSKENETADANSSEWAKNKAELKKFEEDCIKKAVKRGLAEMPQKGKQS